MTHTDPDSTATADAVRWRDVAAQPCPVWSTLELVGDRWSILIVRDVMHGVRRFDDLVERLGVSRATLADRLRKLVDDGILQPTDYVDRRGRQRTEYRLTPRGWDLRNVLIALREWGETHLMEPGEYPTRLVQRDTGHEVQLALIDRETGETIDPTTVRTVPGPGYVGRREPAEGQS